MDIQIYPRYIQYDTPYFSYVFKFEKATSLTLKISDISKKNIVKIPLSNEQLGKEYLDRISDMKEFSTILEHFVDTGILLRKYFPVSTKIELVQEFIQKKDWPNAEKIALEELQHVNEAERTKIYNLLEKIYTASAPEKLEKIWIAQGEAYLETSQLSEAEKIYEKTFSRFKSFNTAFKLAYIFNSQKEIKKSIQTYYRALELALLDGDFDNVSLCIQSIRNIDPQLELLDSNQRMHLLIQAQILKVSEMLQSHHWELFKFLTLAPSHHSDNTLLDAALQQATSKGRADIIKMSMKYPELINIHKYPNPLINIAAGQGNVSAVEAFLTHPDINIAYKGNGGPRETALSSAEKGGHKDIVSLLYNHSKALEEDFKAFKTKPLGAMESLRIHIYQQYLFIIGIDQKGKNKLLDISLLKNQTLQYFEQLVTRGLKGIKSITANPLSQAMLRNTSSFSCFPQALIYLEGERIEKELGKKMANVCMEISEKIDTLVEYACVAPAVEAVIYRAIKLKDKGYFS